MPLKTIFIIFAALIFAPAADGQSCGGGKSIFHIFDETGRTEIKSFYISLTLVSEDQSWKSKAFRNPAWEFQTLDADTAKKYQTDRPRESFETAFEISYEEYSKLLEKREKIVAKSPQGLVATTEKDRCGNFLQESIEDSKKPFSICTTEGCDFMIAAEVQAKGYETGYFVSDFNCGCTKHYELRLKTKREKCLPEKPEKRSS